jgi:hypothetical protein
MHIYTIICMYIYNNLVNNYTLLAFFYIEKYYYFSSTSTVLKISIMSLHLILLINFVFLRINIKSCMLDTCFPQSGVIYTISIKYKAISSFPYIPFSHTKHTICNNFYQSKCSKWKHGTAMPLINSLYKILRVMKSGIPL